MLGYAIAIAAGLMMLGFGVAGMVVLLGSQDVPDDLDIGDSLAWPDDARERAA